MPGQKRKYSVRFPPGRIKKIMQKDTEVGRIATAVPVIISQALEMFLKSLLTKTCQITKSKHSKVMSISHVKQCIETEKLFDFLKELAEHATMTTKREGRGKALSNHHSHRRKCQEMSVSQQNQVEKRHGKNNQDNLDKQDSSTVMLF